MDIEQAPNANYEYWLHVRVWTARETAALFLGFEPKYTEYFWDSFYSSEPEDTIRTAAANERKNLEKILQSAQMSGELGKVVLNQVGEPWGNTVKWRNWTNWAKKNDITISQTLSEAIDKFQSKVSTENPSEEISTRREATLLRTIASLLHVLTQDSSRSEAEIIRQIADLFGHIPGVAKSTMQRDFAEAKRRLTDY